MRPPMKEYNAWDRDLTDSTKAIQGIKDTVLPKLISGSLYSIEKSSNEILLWMDIYSGIDIVRKNSDGLQGVASRVQFGHAYNTFTIRSERHTGAKTELEKRLKQIESGYFYPALTLQAYFDDRIFMNLLSIAVIKTVDLYQAIVKGKKVYTQRSDNKFKFMHWHDLLGFGYPVKIYNHEKPVIEIKEELKAKPGQQLTIGL